MPKPTFDKLPEAKRKRIIDGFLREFGRNDFDVASISLVIKDLGISKGSIYQYFEDKMDLFLFLLQECTRHKLKYIEPIKRTDFPDFWEFFRALFRAGIAFDRNCPLHSHFLHNFAQHANAPTLREWYSRLEQQTLEAFVAMVDHEVGQGLFRTDIDRFTLGYILQQMGIGIQKQLQVMGTIDPEQSMANGLPVYQGQEKALQDMVETYIKAYRPTFENIEQ
ncbi:TetR/AcrR family transcriptional regulator [Muricauda sp. NFXS6]|uniref:TetR/AcrR family transcriptional regulator n=1 Tax=Allomuricauda sp. NFXS6 TaxID=2819094 RepID=UPI0032DF83A2